MKFFVLLACTVVGCSARLIEKRAAGDQTPLIWDALRVLRGGKDLTVEQIQESVATAVPGKDYPINAVIPANNVNCASYKQPGFYADDSAPSNCQVYHRCDTNGVATSYLCPNQSLFNQITLVCDWFYNVDCANSKQFQDYSNSRLYNQNEPLLDNQGVYQSTEVEQKVGVVEKNVPPTPKPKPQTTSPVQKPAKQGGKGVKISGSASSSDSGSFSSSSSSTSNDN